MLMGKYLVIETTASLLRIPLESLVYVKAEGNYSRIFTALDVVKGSKGTLVTYKLGWIHSSLSDVLGDVESKTIVRAGKATSSIWILSLRSTSHNRRWPCQTATGSMWCFPTGCQEKC